MARFSIVASNLWERPLMTAAISVRSLHKSYRVWNHPRDLLLEGLTGRARHQDFQALSGLSFDVPQGSVVGLVGRNGAGKSTLLRIVAGTLDATSGEVQTAGRIAAILELGTGFHPEYSGRENVFLGGLCLGLSRREIEQRFDEIVDFAELREFIDNPFRTYSSGMQARLTFSVATCVDPDILIIDEALGVGDARFQLKSFDRIRQFKQRGKSILLVSHNIAQIVSICDRAILLERGQILQDGDPNTVGKIYHEMLFSPQRGETALCRLEDAGSDGPRNEGADPSSVISADVPTAMSGADDKPGAQINAENANSREHRYGLHEVQISDVWIEDEHGTRSTLLHSLECYRLVIRLRAERASQQLHVGFLIRDIRGAEIFGWDTASGGAGSIPPLGPGEVREMRVAFRANLAAGNFFVTAATAHLDGAKQDVRFDCLDFVVAPTPTVFSNSLVNLDVSVVKSAV
jgi:ABC-type polysaccharide/polyol phosphate transport system ATPase subunit